jgi:4-amino-4-deoxy-L-arabinose transferase-like glycosyltransferase
MVAPGSGIHYILPIMTFPENQAPYWKKLFGFTALLFSFRLLLAALLPLSPQEAYYWVYSLHPAFSYFDHPPLVAYTIGFFTWGLGDHSWAIRLGALLYGTGTAWLAYGIGRDTFNPRVGFRAAVLVSLLPTYSINTLIMTPDAPLVFFWTLSLYLSLQAVRSNRPSYFLAAGPALGAALLSKYTAVFLPISLGLFFLIASDQRRHWRRWELYGGLLAALLLFSPVLLWNMRHEWASFAFQSADRARELGGFSWKHLGAFWASQAGVLTPLVLAGMAAAVAVGMKNYFREKRWAETFLLCLSLPLIGLFILVATREWVKMNWLIPAYLPLIILMAAYFGQDGRSRFLKKAGTWTGTTVVFFFLLLHLWWFVPQLKVSGSMDTLTGWPALAEQLLRTAPRSPAGREPFLLAWGHKTAAELAFYTGGRLPVVAQTALNHKALAYDYWFDPAPLKGRDALFVWSSLENYPFENTGLLRQFFERVEKAAPFIVYRGKQPLRTFRIYRCYGYKGFDFKKP